MNHWSPADIEALQLDPAQSGVVLLVHGTRNPRAVETIVAELSTLKASLARTLGLPDSAVVFSFLEAIEPHLETALDDLAQAGKTDIRILPLLLFPGTHFYKDIPEIARTVMERHAAVRIKLCNVLGVNDTEFTQILLKRLIPKSAPKAPVAV